MYQNFIVTEILFDCILILFHVVRPFSHIHHYHKKQLIMLLSCRCSKQKSTLKVPSHVFVTGLQAACYSRHMNVSSLSNLFSTSMLPSKRFFLETHPSQHVMYVAVVNIAAQKIKLLNTSTLLRPQVQLLGLPLTHQNNYSLVILKSHTKFTILITKYQLFVISNLESYEYYISIDINHI